MLYTSFNERSVEDSILNECERNREELKNLFADEQLPVGAEICSGFDEQGEESKGCDEETETFSFDDLFAKVKDGSMTQEEADRHINSIIDAQLLVTTGMECPKEPCTLSVDGVPFFAIGDIHAIKAKQKMGKTRTISIFVSALLSTGWNRVKTEMTGLRILLLDTEQKKSDSKLIYNSILEMAGREMVDDLQHFNMLSMRRLTIAEKKAAIKARIAKFSPNVVFIDGVVDLIENFNDVNESCELIKDLMHWSTEYNCAIINVLHTNKSLDDHNMRGHLGSMLAQKAGNVLECTKEDGIFTVKDSDARYKPVPEWSFKFDDDGKIIPADEAKKAQAKAKQEAKAQKKRDEMDKKREEWFQELEKVFRANGITETTGNDLRKMYMKEFGLSDSVAKRHIQALLECGKLNGEYTGIVSLPK